MPRSSRPVSLASLASVCALPLLLTTLGLAGTGCSATLEDDGAGASEDDLNYRSTAGQEFSLSTTVTFKPSAEVLALSGAAKDAAVLARSQELRGTVTAAI